MQLDATPLMPAYFRLFRAPSNCNVTGEEGRTCIKFANALKAWTMSGQLKAVWFHVANEIATRDKSPRSYGFENKLKAMGKICGVSDYVFGSATGIYFLEMKAKKGTLTDQQKDFKLWCESQGVPYYVAKSFEEAEAKLREWKILI